MLLWDHGGEASKQSSGMKKGNIIITSREKAPQYMKHKRVSDFDRIKRASMIYLTDDIRITGFCLFFYLVFKLEQLNEL